MLAEFVARIEETGLPKCVLFRELVGVADCVGGQGKSGWSISWMTSELSILHWTNTVQDGEE